MKDARIGVSLDERDKEQLAKQALDQEADVVDVAVTQQVLLPVLLS